ncbi:hypothetical protein AGR13a_Lc30084 [Agrobacterium genomosp. 13 str. CFBP 6927]|uniref:Uncharacterized protein n=1 Tax=Agrobacterium genomosp. 13 str. CFBP 6927 TaxID=1183428 RepID=A0ABM9VL98_9HYPH|nr:hypothetical protein AGR13a_Lc30084 [Agrobacterium genomosp. 13 str. CFBP 6927]
MLSPVKTFWYQEFSRHIAPAQLEDLKRTPVKYVSKAAVKVFLKSRRGLVAGLGGFLHELHQDCFDGLGNIGP